MGGDVDEAKAEVDGVLERWRQGDCVLGEHAFLYGIDPDLPLTPESELGDEEGGRFASVEGVVQTLKGITADDYVHSDPLDLDHLSDSAA